MEDDKGIDALYEVLTLRKEYNWPETPPFEGFSSNPKWWRYHGPFPVPLGWNPENLRDVIYLDDKCRRHKTYGPAYVSKLYDIETWYKHDELHREGGPAYRHKGNCVWFKDGKLHNLEGPAVVAMGHPLQYWIDGVKYSKKQYKWEIARRKRKGLIK